jgi:2-polyprenyl-6-methoxyphenol hydroxylase-like FAD-dependent oxidoreductase
MYDERLPQRKGDHGYPIRPSVDGRRTERLVFRAMSDRPRILIVGAGIAGLTLAAGLERCGITPVVVEIASESLSRGLALLLTSNAGLALRAIGLEKVVIERGIVLEQIVQTDSSGTPNAHHDLRPSNDRYSPNIGITRDALISGISSATRAQIRYSTTITALECSDSTVRVALSDGTKAEFDLVVGADGINSVVRKLTYPDVQPAYRSFCAWRTVLDYSDCDRVCTFRSGPGRLLGSFQVGRNLLYVFLLAYHPKLPSLSRDEHLERFKELARYFGGSLPSLIQGQNDPARVVFVPVQEVETQRYYRNRTLLIGDAAHAFPPLLAQGAAMAIEDAAALSELLKDSANVEQALRSYEARRRRRVETIRAAVRHRGIVRGLEGPVTPESLNQHPPVLSNSLKVYDDLIEDPFARA